MTDLLQNLQAAIRKIRRLQADNAALTRMLNEASDKLAQLTKPLFNVGDVVTVWRGRSIHQDTVVYGEGEGNLSTERVSKVYFHWGEYHYDMESPLCNIMEHLIQKAG